MKTSTLMVLVALSLARLAFAGGAEGNGSLYQREERKLMSYLESGGRDRGALATFGPGAIHKMTAMMDGLQRHRKVPAMAALTDALLNLPLSDEERRIGKGAIYKLLEEDNAAIRLAALDLIGKLDGEGATNAWLRLLEDPSEMIRLATLEELAYRGNKNAAIDIAQFLKTRAQTSKPNDVAKDETLAKGAKALRILAERAKGKTIEQIMEEELRRKQDELRKRFNLPF